MEHICLHILLFSHLCPQIQVLKVLVNLSSNPDIMDEIVQAQVKYGYICWNKWMVLTNKLLLNGLLWLYKFWG